MKPLFIDLLIILFSVSCSEKECLSPTEVVILGNQTADYATESRGKTSILAEGTQISLFANSGIKADGQILSLVNGRWKGNESLYWNESQQKAEVCAYNPPLATSADGYCSASQLYTKSGELTDILISQNTYQPGAPITLHFEHLFAQLTLKLEPTLNQRVKTLQLTPSMHIAQLNPYTAQMTTATGANYGKITYQPKASGTYQLLLPPLNNQEVNIIITTHDGDILQKSLSNLLCQQGTSYTCTLKAKSNNIGIETAEDFIAFTNLMNETAYGKRTLNEFGITRNGITTYYLKNDIQFTEAEKKRIRPINKKKFTDIFDGQNHTLTNVEIIDERCTMAGLFAIIDKSGIIKNLNIHNCHTNFQLSKGGATGIICGHNDGKIINCSIKDCTCYAYKPYTGGIAGENYGNIINCEVEGFTLLEGNNFKHTLGYFGGITGVLTNNGKVLNCRISGLQLKSNSKHFKHASCIVTISQGNISNCLIENCDLKLHPFCYFCRSHCRYCFYPQNMEKKVAKTEGMNEQERKDNYVCYFTPTTESHKATVNLLNKWIDQEGSKLFPEYTFRRWKLNTGPSISLEK